MTDKQRDIYDRIYQLIIQVLEYVRKLPRTLEISVVAKQLIRSVTSIGANSQEADGSESKAEFIHRFSIAKKEAKESLYWLRILAEITDFQNDVLRNELN